VKRRASSVILVALFAGFACAQDPAPVAPAQETTLGAAELKWDRVQQVHYEHGTGILYLLGDVEAVLQGRRIRCQNLIAWLDLERKQALSPPPSSETPTLVPPDLQAQLKEAREWVKEVYAEGHVLYEEPGRLIQADRLYLDLRKERGLVVDATVGVQLDTRNGPVPLVAKAQELRLLSTDRMVGSGVQTFISPLGRSETFLHQEELEFIKDPPRLDAAGNEIINYNVASRGNVLHAANTPVLWLPDFVGDTAEGRNTSFLESVRFSRSNKFGLELGVSVGDEILDKDGVRWGKWTVDVDWFTKRGPGFGGRLDYGTEDYYGTVIGRYQRDHGKDKFFGDPDTKNRGRLSAWHRHQLPEGFQLDAELQIFSDEGYFPTFFEDDFKELKPPENLLYLKKPFFNSQISALASQRFSRWFTTVEHTPELRYDLITDPLFDIGDSPLFLTATVRASNSRIEYARGLDLRPRNTMRFDADTLLEYPIDVGPFKLIPFAGVRTSWFQRDLDGDRGRNRYGFTTGATLALKAWKIYDSFGGLFNLEGLRHVIEPEVTFRNTSGVRIDPSELIRFDDIEDFDNEQVVELRLRNLLQTIRTRRGIPSVETFIDLNLEQRYYPNAGRDHDGNPFGNLEADLLVQFSDDFQFLTDFELNYYGRGFEVANIAFGYTPSDNLQIYSGFRHFHETYDAVFLQANYRIDEKWMTTLETSYDFSEDRGIEHRAVLSHIGPEWVFQLGFRADLGQDDFGIVFSFEPRWLFNPVISPSALRAEPRLLYLGSGLSR
jgi:hypothetical protein